MLAVLVSGGEISSPELFSPLFREADFLVAVDSGYHLFQVAGVKPNLLVGDLDSISPEMLAHAREAAVDLITFPTEKDYTDTELAIKQAVDNGCSTILVVAPFGDRIDHTLANVLLLTSPKFRNYDLRLLNEFQEVRLIKGSISIRSHPGEVISLLPLSDVVEGITTAGLYYRLQDANMIRGPALGISNVATSEIVSVSVVSGDLLLVRIFQNGLDPGEYIRNELGCKSLD